MNVDEIVKWRQSAEHRIAFEDFKLNSTEALDRLKHQVEYSQAALRNLTLVNGGVIVALLTFIGNAAQKVDATAIWWAFVWLSIGLFLALLSYLGAYFSQSYFMEVPFQQAWQAQGSDAKFSFDKQMALGNRALYFGIGCTLLSIISFVTVAFVGLSGLI